MNALEEKCLYKANKLITSGTISYIVHIEQINLESLIINTEYK